MHRFFAYLIVTLVAVSLCVSDAKAVTLDDGTIVSILEVKIQTAHELFAGPDDLPFVNLRIPKAPDIISNNAYLDLGFMAFALGNEFRSGETRSQKIDLTKTPPFTVGDITMVGLRKHGLFDINNAPDSLADGLLKGGLTPDAFMSQIKHDLQLAHESIDLARRAFDLEEKAWEAQQRVVNSADRAVNESRKLSDAAKAELDIARKAAKAAADRLNATPREIEETIVKTIPTKIKAHILVPSFPVPKMKEVEVPGPGMLAKEVVKKKNSLWDIANKAKDDAEAKISGIEAHAKAAADQLNSLVNAKTAADNLAILHELKRNLARNSLLEAEMKLSIAESHLELVRDIFKLLPLPSLGIPKPGEWKPKSVTLVINGEEFVTYEVNERLKQGHPAWVKYLKNLHPELQFAHRLRIVKPPEGEPKDELLGQLSGALTTPVKELGISGWEDDLPLSEAIITGKLVHPPSAGSDLYVSLDLEVESVTAQGKTVECNTPDGVRHGRYIRVEYHTPGMGPLPALQSLGWKEGNRFRVSGKIRFDTDRAGHVEIHPRIPTQIEKLGGR